MSRVIRRASIVGPGDIRVITAAAPPATDGEVRLAVEAVGVCGTDLSLVRDGSAPPEQVPGHEIVARVLDAPSAAALAVGARVMVRPIRGCHECWYCLNELEHQCDHSADLTISYGRRGGFSDELVIAGLESGEIVPVADGVDTLDAVWAEPLAVAVHLVSRALMDSAHDEVVVIGAGPLGLCATAAASARGLRVTAVEPRPGRRAAARVAGATDVRHPDDVGELRSSQVCVTVGGDPAMAMSDSIARPGGIVVYAGLGATRLNPIPRPYTVKGSFGYTPEEFLTSAGLINDGTVSLGPLVSHVIGLDDIAEAIRISATEPDAVKVVVSPNGA